MSGPGDGGGSPPPDGGGGCGSLEFEAALNSVVESILAIVGVGSVLDVQRRAVGGVTVIGAVEHSTGELLGTLTSHVPELLRCLQEGYSYDATIASIYGGAVRVRVTPR